jgi:hypothetical protein
VSINVLHRVYSTHRNSCMLQDSDSDWTHEAGRMGHVYARTVCTISTTASRDSNGGLFFDRNLEVFVLRLIQPDFNGDDSWLEGRLMTVV